MKATIYTISDHTGCVRYVGMTTRSVKQRFANHKGNRRSAIGRFVRSEIDAGRRLVVRVEEVLDSASFKYGALELRHESRDTEKRYIDGYRRLVGSKLLNQPNGRRAKPCNVIFEQSSSISEAT